MTSPRRLFLIRLLHTVIYVVMAASALLVLFAAPPTSSRSTRSLMSLSSLPCFVPA